jgi:hypothetical protein
MLKPLKNKSGNESQKGLDRRSQRYLRSKQIRELVPRADIGPVNSLIALIHIWRWEAVSGVPYNCSWPTRKGVHSLLLPFAWIIFSVRKHNTMWAYGEIWRWIFTHSQLQYSLACPLRAPVAFSPHKQSVILIEQEAAWLQSLTGCGSNICHHFSKPPLHQGCTIVFNRPREKTSVNYEKLLCKQRIKFRVYHYILNGNNKFLYYGFQNVRKTSDYWFMSIYFWVYIIFSTLCTCN